MILRFHSVVPYFIWTTAIVQAVIWIVSTSGQFDWWIRWLGEWGLYYFPTMGIVSYFFLPVPNLFLTMTIFVLVASIAGFFPFNYRPAILYLGTPVALFISLWFVLSLQGLRKMRQLLVVTPMIVLGYRLQIPFSHYPSDLSQTKIL